MNSFFEDKVWDFLATRFSHSQGTSCCYENQLWR